MNFTKEEISLCKQVAEKYRKEIKKGAWVMQEKRADFPLLVIDTQGEFVTASLGYDKKTDTHYENCTLLWSISDCLEFLREKGLEWIDIRIHYPDTSVVIWARRVRDLDQMKNYTTGDSLLEACLKAVLAVFEE